MLDQEGNTVALLAEDSGGFGKEVGRQLLRTRRSFTATILTPDGGQVICRVRRPFYLINVSHSAFDWAFPSLHATPCMHVRCGAVDLDALPPPSTSHHVHNLFLTMPKLLPTTHSFACSMTRQWLRSAAAATAAWQSSIFIEDGAGEVVGEVHARWHPWQRNYDLYLAKRQFASINSGLLAWEFVLRDKDGGAPCLT